MVQPYCMRNREQARNQADSMARSDSYLSYAGGVAALVVAGIVGYSFPPLRVPVCVPGILVGIGLVFIGFCTYNPFSKNHK